MSNEPTPIQNEEELSKQLYRLRKLNEEQAHEDERYQKEIDESDAWYQPSKQARKNQIDEVEALIDDFYMRQYENNPYYRFKSRNGSVSKRESTSFIHDDKKLLSNVPDKFIKKSLKWGDYKKTLQDTGNGTVVDENGEIVDGVTAKRYLKVIVKTTGEN